MGDPGQKMNREGDEWVKEVAGETAAKRATNAEKKPREAHLRPSAPTGIANREGIPRRAKWFGWVDPGGIGCLIVALFLIIALAFFAQDVVHTLKASNTPVPTVAAVGPGYSTPLAAQPSPPPSRVILGTDGEGLMYYFKEGQGVYAREAPSAEPTRIISLPGFAAHHWSPSRNRIAFVTHNRSNVLPMLYVVDVQTPTLTLASPHDPDRFPADFGLQATSPVAWSPDEVYVAFVAYDGGHRAALLVSEVMSGTVTRLTEGSEPVTSVGWEIVESDQGEKVQRVVYALRRAGDTHLYTVEPNGANRQRWRKP